MLLYPVPLSPLAIETRFMLITLITYELRIMPAVSAVLLSAAIGGIWLAWRAPREDTPP